MKNKRYVILLVITIIIMLALLSIIIKQKFYRYDVNMKIIKYDLRQEKDDYLNYLKQLINPIKLRNFIDNDAVAFSIYNDTATGHTIKNQMEFKAYKSLFTSMFDKERNDYNNCPVTDNFKKKFNKNLLYYFNLNESEDCGSMCSLYRKDKEIIVEVYGNFKNTEPTYWTTHHFHYTLDDEGNVDDIVFDYMDK